MAETLSAYADLERRFDRLGNIRDAETFLHWDASTMMPANSAESRGNQLSTLRALHHQMLTDPAMDDLLANAAANSLDEWQRANLREMTRTHTHATAVESDLVEALSKATTACESVWRAARPDADFAAVKDLLDEVLNLVRQSAVAKGERLGCSPYDALLDEHSPGVSGTVVDALFADLETFLPDLLAQVVARQEASPPLLELQGPFASDAQEALGKQLMSRIGFDFDKGRLDISLHPFSSGTPDDLRITTRYEEEDFTTGLMGILHETGHALYEAGLPEDWRCQPVGEARGMDVHESQSLLMEMQACRSMPFLEFAAPLMRQAFNADPGDPAWQPDNLYRLYTRVKPGFIRVDADEVTYPAHIILRHGLERSMIDDDLAVDDLPGAWAEGMRKYLGLAPPDDRQGCLQDIHWYDGAFGYFPSYTLGAMAAAQFYDAATRALPGIPEALSAGNFAPLMEWLRVNVHGKGSCYETPELIEKATGQPLDPEIFKRHLRTRYLGESRLG